MTLPPSHDPYGNDPRPTHDSAAPEELPSAWPPNVATAQRPPVKSKRGGRLILLVIVVLTLLGVGSCLALATRNSDNAGTKAQSAASSAQATPKPGDEPSEVDEPEDEDKPDLPVFVVGKFGDRGIYKDGISVSILSADLEQGTDGTYVLIRAKIKNGSKKSFDPSDADVSVTYGKDATPATRVEQAHKTHVSFGNKIAAHKSKTAKFGFQVTKKQAKSLQVTITPDAQAYRALTFKGSAR